MVLPWRRSKVNHSARKFISSETNLDMEVSVPSHFRCPISLDLMKDPVTLPTGITYDRESIEKWIEAGHRTCPVTNQELQTFDQIPNHTIRRMIQEWCVQNRSSGVERIPTPRVPVTPYDVSDACSKIVAATKRVDGKKCLDLVKKIKNWARESERNQKCVVNSGAAAILSSSFNVFSSLSIHENEALLGEILSILTWMFPKCDEEGRSKLSSNSSLRCMAWFLKGEDLSRKQSAVLVLRQLFSYSLSRLDAFVEIEGVEEALVKIVKEQICLKATKASLTVIFFITTSSKSEIITSKFVELGIISMIFDILVSGSNTMSEKALGALDDICSCSEGLKEVRNNALSMPILVKKMLRVPGRATEFAVSIVWKLCKSVEDNGGIDHDQVVEALQLGGFQKLLVVLQVGCGEKTKEKATELLKLLNQYRDRIDCFDSSMMGFRYMRRT